MVNRIYGAAFFTLAYLALATAIASASPPDVASEEHKVSAAQDDKSYLPPWMRARQGTSAEGASIMAPVSPASGNENAPQKVKTVPVRHQDRIGSVFLRGIVSLFGR